jgi:hypothetical protein
MSRTIEQFKGRPPAQRFSTVVLIAVSLGLVATAERDIQRRPADQVRGSKLLWRFVCLNALGAAGYMQLGRRGGATLMLGLPRMALEERDEATPSAGLHNIHYRALRKRPNYRQFLLRLIHMRTGISIT